ncbi:recombination associated protein RdgC [Luteibacter sp. UNC138MFCol5.1]|uniref:recombination-associated protein RdgC n=1 Tax=Luteibacter sp. UNC138MFCol5.1 TaxID=1502774 RepID=UPI0008B2AB16|nr:recombination-associated protein RdgC [Luteibacter sp. UNC138MFCol5.1]SEO64108.1 recombination associated protein RdgC [Luteibacter sp. UNC138MFCol5.1]
MFFRNLTLFRFSPAVAEDLARLDEVLPEHRLRDVGPMELSTRGFVSPTSLAAHDLTHHVGAVTSIAAGSQTKLLPPGVVNDEIAKRVEKIAEAEGRKVSGRERKRIKDDVLNELLPRAFVRASRIRAYADARDGWLVVDTASRRAAEDVLSQLREALGSFPAVPLAPEESPRVLMTHWVATGKLPTGFELGDEIELRDPATASGAVARCRRQDLDTDEVREHLRTGKQVFRIGLVFDDRISFVLGEDLVLRKVRFTDVVLDEVPDEPESAAAEADANLALMMLEHGRLFERLATIFNLPRPE